MSVEGNEDEAHGLAQKAPRPIDHRVFEELFEFFPHGTRLHESIRDSLLFNPG
jgi:hypothetical protein